jgi:hypothetical protein
MPASGQGLFEQAINEADQPGSPKSDEDSTDTISVTPTQTVEFNGYIRGTVFAGKVYEQDVTEIKSGYAEVSGKIKVRLGEYGDGHAELRLGHGLYDAQIGEMIELREAYVDTYLGNWDLRFGHQIIAWGRADGFNPTDNLTPKNMQIRSAEEDDRRIANLALRITGNYEPVRLELVYVPFYAPSSFPNLGQLGPIIFDQPDYPDADFEHGTAATRLNVELDIIDFSASYLFGYSTFPGIGLSQFEFTPPQPTFSIQFRGYQHHVVGADFSTTIGDSLGFRGEAALRWPLEKENSVHVPLPDIQYILGFDKEFFGEVTVIAQYVGRTVLDWSEIEPTGLLDLAQGKPISLEQQAQIASDPQGAALTELKIKNRMIAGQLDQLSHSGFLRIQWQLLQETLSIEIMGMYNFSTQELMIRPKIAYSITDGLKATIGGEIYDGPDNTLYGMVDETLSALFMEIKAFF